MDHQRTTSRNLKISLIVTLALILMVAMIVSSDRLDRIFIRQNKLYVYLADATGLHTGALVQLNGIEIGSVRAIRFYGNGVLITMQLKRSSLKRIKKDTRAIITTRGMLGDRYVELTPGSATGPTVSTNDTIQGIARVRFERIIETSLASIATVEAFINRLDTLLLDLESGKGTLGALIKDRVLYDNLRMASTTLADAAEAYERRPNSLKSLLQTDTLYRSLASAVSEVEGLVYDLRTSNGTVAHLIRDSLVYDDLFNSVKGFRALSDSLANPNSSLMLLSNERFTKELHQAVTNVNDLLKDIKANPGRYIKLKIF